MIDSKKNIGLRQTLTQSGGVIVEDKFPESNSDAFQLRMKELVEHVGSMAEIARKCGLPESTVKKWVDGISDPSRERCIALARGTGVSLLWLVTGEGPMKALQSPLLRGSQDERFERGILAIAAGLLNDLLAAMQGRLGGDDYVNVLLELTDLLRDDEKAVPAKIVEISRFIAQRKENTVDGNGTSGEARSGTKDR